MKKKKKAKKNKDIKNLKFLELIKLYIIITIEIFKRIWWVIPFIFTIILIAMTY